MCYKMAEKLQRHQVTPNIVYIAIVSMILILNAAKCLSSNVTGRLADELDIEKLLKTLQSDDLEMMTEDYNNMWDAYFNQTEQMDLKHDSTALIEKWVFMTEELDNKSRTSGGSTKVENGILEGFSKHHELLSSAITLYKAFNSGKNIHTSEVQSKRKDGNG